MLRVIGIGCKAPIKCAVCTVTSPFGHLCFTPPPPECVRCVLFLVTCVLQTQLVLMLQAFGLGLPLAPIEYL